MSAVSRKRSQHLLYVPPIYGGVEVEASSLTKRYGGFTALNDVSFKISEPGCYGYLGPNGAGKTTTMKIFTNLIRPTSGHAYINGMDVNRHPVKALKSVASLVEDPIPYDFMTGAEFITFAAKIRGKAKPDLSWLRSVLDLPDLDKLTSKLSKGQKRRIFLAALVAQDAPIIILDEPTSGLDPKESMVIRDLLRTLKKDKVIIMSSHLLYEVTQVCDYVYFVYQGKIVDRGPLSTVESRYTSKTLRVEFYSEPPESAFRDLVVSRDGEHTYLVSYDGSDRLRRSILDQLYPYGLRSFSDSELGLEEAYRQVIQ